MTGTNDRLRIRITDAKQIAIHTSLSIAIAMLPRWSRVVTYLSRVSSHKNNMVTRKDFHGFSCRSYSKVAAATEVLIATDSAEKGNMSTPERSSEDSTREILLTDIEVDEDVEQEDKPGVRNLLFYKRQNSKVKVLFISLLLRAFTSNSAESNDHDDNSSLSISYCIEKCWNNCSCVGFTTSNSNAGPEKFSGFQVKHSRFQIVN
ncbi:unnamed protein product [Camellia sinensis]